VFLLEPNAITRELCRKRVTVVDYPDGRLAIRYRGLDLPYTTFDKLRQVSQATIVENKHSQPEGAAPPRADRPHVQSRLSRIQPPHSHAGTAPARRQCLSVPFSATDKTP
jgi:hypothetical protein